MTSGELLPSMRDLFEDFQFIMSNLQDRTLFKYLPLYTVCVCPQLLIYVTYVRTNNELG